MSEELLPCPFCGGEAHLSNWSDGAYVWCECGIKTETYLKSGCADKAIEAWNRRAYEVIAVQNGNNNVQIGYVMNFSKKGHANGDDK